MSIHDAVLLVLPDWSKASESQSSNFMIKVQLKQDKTRESNKL
jgi:hypothetical protein